MYPPIYKVCSSNPAVTAILGASPLRMYQFGLAPQLVVKPYATWQTISGSPENYLWGRPDADGFTIQVDIFRPLLRRLEMPPWPSGMRLSFQPM